MMRVAKSRMRRFGMQNYELDAEDAVQNAFVKITKYIDKIDFHAEDMDVPEIAYLLGLPEKTVYTRLYRAKKILLEALNTVNCGFDRGPPKEALRFSFGKEYANERTISPYEQ